MVERYDLEGKKPPALPCPHDCVIRRISHEGWFLEFEFEENLTAHDSVAAIRPDAWSLVIRYHLLGYGYQYYKWCSKEGKEGFLLKPREALRRLPEHGDELTYLTHYVARGALIVVLFKGTSFRRVEMASDYVEYEWVEADDANG